jgi:hypothetical protein
MKLKADQSLTINDSQRFIRPAIELKKGRSSIPKRKNITFTPSGRTRPH